MADLSTKSHPVARLDELKELWGIVRIPEAEGEEQVKVKTLQIIKEEDIQHQGDEGYWAKIMKLMIVTIGSQLILKALEGKCKRRMKYKEEEDETLW